MQYQSYKRQQLPLGSGITEAACKLCSRSGSSARDVMDDRGWSSYFGPGVIRLSHVWDEVHQRYLASKPMPIAQVEVAKGPQHGQLAA